MALIEIDDFPSERKLRSYLGDFPWRTVSHNQMVFHKLYKSYKSHINPVNGQVARLWPHRNPNGDFIPGPSARPSRWRTCETKLEKADVLLWRRKA